MLIYIEIKNMFARTSELAFLCQSFSVSLAVPSWVFQVDVQTRKQRREFVFCSNYGKLSCGTFVKGARGVNDGKFESRSHSSIRSIIRKVCAAKSITQNRIKDMVNKTLALNFSISFGFNKLGFVKVEHDFLTMVRRC